MLAAHPLRWPVKPGLCSHVTRPSLLQETRHHLLPAPVLFLRGHGCSPRPASPILPHAADSSCSSCQHPLFWKGLWELWIVVVILNPQGFRVRLGLRSGLCVWLYVGVCEPCLLPEGFQVSGQRLLGTPSTSPVPTPTKDTHIHTIHTCPTPPSSPLHLPKFQITIQFSSNPTSSSK